jgi:hypothetical protein
MKTWAKLAVGCLVVILLFCVLSVAAMFFMPHLFKGLWNRFGGGAALMTKNIQAIQETDKSFPFSEPESGDVDEGRLQAYIAVASGVKTAMMPFEEWIKTHQKNGKGETGEKGDWKDVKEALQMSAALLGAIKTGLEEQKMGSKEFHWIEGKMGEAQREGGSGPSEAQKQMVDSSVQVLEQQMNQPGTTDEAKAQIQEQVDRLRATVDQSGGEGASNNRQLYLKYETELKNCDLSEFGEFKVN